MVEHGSAAVLPPFTQGTVSASLPVDTLIVALAQYLPVLVPVAAAVVWFTLPTSEENPGFACAADAGLESAAKGVISVAAPSTIPADHRAFLVRIMSCAPSYEIAILTVAAAWDSTFERDAHESVGRSVGLTDDELRAIRERRLPDVDDPVERVCAEVALALTDGDLDDALWSSAASTLGAATIFELTTLVGYYATLALQLRVFRVGGA